jgi:C-terminal processing protease CtpA/Prc
MVYFIGLKFKKIYKEFPEVDTVFAGGPASIAQLRDIITKVDGHPTNVLNQDEIYRMLVGQPDTKVNVTIRRGDATLVKTLNRLRGKEFAKIYPDIWKMYQSTK